MTVFFPGVSESERGGGQGVTVLILDRPKIAAMGLPGGMIYRWAGGVGTEVRNVARGLLASHGGVRTGALLRSTQSSATPVAPLPGVQVNVRATARHALMYIRGTRPHVITTVGQRTTVYRATPPPWTGKKMGDTDWGFMKFFWLKGGKIRYEQTVHHPGWRGYNYLDEAKTLVLRARGIT